MTEREARLTLVIGKNGTGKSTVCLKLIQAINQAGGRALVVTPDEIEWNGIDWVHDRLTHHIASYKGNRKMLPYKNKNADFLNDINKYFRSGIVIFDDSRASGINQYSNDDIRRLCIRRRQKEMDVVIVAHGFTEIPPLFYTYATHIILFKTTDNIKRRKDVLKDYDKMVLLQEEVNQHPDPHHSIIYKYN